MAVLGPPCCVQVISSCREQGLVFVVCKPLIVVASLIAEHGLSSYGLVAPQHVGSSHIRDRTHIFCIGQRILNHWLHSASIIAYGIAHFLLTMWLCARKWLLSNFKWDKAVYLSHCLYYFTDSVTFSECWPCQTRIYTATFIWKPSHFPSCSAPSLELPPPSYVSLDVAQIQHGRLDVWFLCKFSFRSPVRAQVHSSTE